MAASWILIPLGRRRRTRPSPTQSCGAEREDAVSQSYSEYRLSNIPFVFSFNLFNPGQLKSSRLRFTKTRKLPVSTSVRGWAGLRATKDFLPRRRHVSRPESVVGWLSLVEDLRTCRGWLVRYGRNLDGEMDDVIDSLVPPAILWRRMWDTRDGKVESRGVRLRFTDRLAAPSLRGPNATAHTEG